jgi:hypothetical protein
LPVPPGENHTEAGATPLPSMPLVVVVTLLSGGLPPDSAVAQGTEGGGDLPAEAPPNRPASPTLSGEPATGPPTFVPVSGDEQLTRSDVLTVVPAEELNVVPAAGPNLRDALRNLRLVPPSDDEVPHPTGEAPLPTASVPRPSDRRPPFADADLLWQDLSWLERQPPDRLAEVSCIWDESGALALNAALSNPAVAAPLAGIDPGPDNSAERPVVLPALADPAAETDWTERLAGLTVIGVVGLPWAGLVGERRQAGASQWGWQLRREGPRSLLG